MHGLTIAFSCFAWFETTYVLLRITPAVTGPGLNGTNGIYSAAVGPGTSPLHNSSCTNHDPNLHIGVMVTSTQGCGSGYRLTGIGSDYTQKKFNTKRSLRILVEPGTNPAG